MARGIDNLKSNLPPECWTEDTDIIAPCLVEWRERYQGQTPIMMTPGSTAETVQIVKICAEYGLKIVPQGGNTGLAGGQIPQGEILLSTRRMTAIRDVNQVTNALVAEAGATLLSVQEAAVAADRKFPLSLASEGSCTIGGNLSTNAGGVHVLKYGTTKDLVFGVEAVLPNGETHNGLTSLRKDNTGYDINRLFLGAEGTLGIITAASLKLFPRPGHIERVMVGLDSPEKAMALLDHCRVSNHLSMFEVMPHIGLKAVIDHIPGQRDPFDAPHPWYALLDWEMDSAEDGRALSEARLSSAFEKGLIRDAVIAQNKQQASALLGLREHLSAAQKGLGASVKQDITVPLNHIPEFIKIADQTALKLVPECRPVAFGHFGDGNIHYNVTQPENMERGDFLARWQDISEAIFDVVDRFEGSISAEHGIGVLKKKDLANRADPAKLALMTAIKKAIDPRNLMNPRVLF